MSVRRPCWQAFDQRHIFRNSVIELLSRGVEIRMVQVKEKFALIDAPYRHGIASEIGVNNRPPVCLESYEIAIIFVTRI